MATTRKPHAPTVSRQLRAAGFLPSSPERQFRHEGVFVGQALDRVSIDVDLDMPGQRARMVGQLREALEGLGYAVTVADGTSTLYVSYPEPKPEPQSLTLQPADVTDQLLPDGTELTHQPYPFHVTRSGEVLRQDIWRSEPATVIGFAARVDVHSIDLYWPAAWADPQRAVGMYLVSSNSQGTWSTHQLAIESVTANA